MNHDLLESLVAASAALQRAHVAARQAGREDVAQCLRKSAWQVASAIVELAPNRDVEVMS